MKQAVKEQQKIEQIPGQLKVLFFLRTLETLLFNDHDLPLHLSSLRCILFCRVQALQDHSLLSLVFSHEAKHITSYLESRQYTCMQLNWMEL